MRTRTEVRGVSLRLGEKKKNHRLRRSSSSRRGRRAVMARARRDSLRVFAVQRRSRVSRSAGRL